MSQVGTKAIRYKLQELFKASPSLKKIKWYMRKPPRSHFSQVPFGWIQWFHGPVKPFAKSKKQIEDLFFITIVDRDIKADKADNSVEDFTDAICAILDANPTIGGLVANSHYTLREKNNLFENEDYSFAFVQITLFTRRLK